MADLDERTNLLVGMAVLAGYTFEPVRDIRVRNQPIYLLRQPDGGLIWIGIYGQLLPDAALAALQHAGITPPTEELKDDSN